MIADAYKTRYYINGINIYDRWGIIIEKGGYAELQRVAKRKEQYARVWKDKNGTERFVADALFEDKAVQLPVTFLCKDLDEYLDKSRGFFDYIKGLGYFKLYSKTLKQEWTLLYDSVASVEDKTEMYQTRGEVLTTHNVVFLDDFTAKNDVGEKEYDTFVSTWDTRNISAGSSDSFSIALPITNMSGLVVDWGDGTVDSLNTHKYATEGIKEVKIKGVVSGFRFNNLGDKNKILSVDCWGSFIKTTNGTFYGCVNLSLRKSIGVPIIENIHSFFWGCSSITNISKLDLLDVTKPSNSFSSVFREDTNFDGIGLEKWDVKEMKDAAAFMLGNTAMTTNQYDLILENWSKQTLQKGVVINFGSAKYTNEKAHDILTNKYGWIITDGGKM